MPDLRSDTDFASWNEEMVRRYDIDRYYEKSHPVVRWTEHRRLAALRSLAQPRAGGRGRGGGGGGGRGRGRGPGGGRGGGGGAAAGRGRARRRRGAAGAGL